MPRLGYRFIAPILDKSAEAEIAENQVAAGPSREVTGHPRRLLWVGLAILAAVIATIAGTLTITNSLHSHTVIRSSAKSPDDGVPQEPVRHMLVVLPFDNLGGSRNQDYFTAGLTEELTTQLSEVLPDKLGVIARTSAARYKQSGEPISEIGRQLGVEYVVEGGVLRARNRVRVNVQLIRVSDQASVWAQEFEGELRDVLILQAKISQAIAREIGITLTLKQQMRLSGARIVNPDAHEAYLRGVSELRKRTAEGLEAAIQYFQQALAREPDNALVYAGLAEAYYQQSTSYKAPLAVMPQAKAAAMQAAGLDDKLADGHAMLGKIKLSFDWDWAGAEREFRRALQLNPSLASAHAGYAEYLEREGRGEEAIRELGRAEQLDPLFPIAHGRIALYLFEQRRYQEAVEAAQTMPQSDNTALALSYAELGQSAEAIEAAERTVASTSNPIALSQAAAALALAGRKDRARELLHSIEGEAAQRYVCGVNLGGVYAVLGDKERALASLERAYRDRSD